MASSARNSRFGPLALLPLGAQLRVLEVDPHDAPVAEPLGPLEREHALAAAHVEHRRRAPPSPRARRGSSGSRPSGASPPGSTSRTCRRCCRSGPRPPSRRRSQLQRLAVLGLAGRAARLRAGGGRLRRSPGRPARSATAATPSWSSTRRTRSSTRCWSTRVPARMSPITPSAASCTATMNMRRAQDQRLDVAAGVVREEEEVEEARPDHRAHERRERGRRHEHAQRLVHRVDAEDRDRVAPDVRPHRREQARLARLARSSGSGRGRRPRASCPPG